MLFFGSRAGEPSRGITVQTIQNTESSACAFWNEPRTQSHREMLMHRRVPLINAELPVGQSGPLFVALIVRLRA